MVVDAVDSSSAIENAWKIHGVLADWTGKVDAKASFALTIEAAALAVVVGLSGGDRRFSNLDGPFEHILFWVGVALLAVSAVTATLVVVPRIRNKHVKDEWQDNFIYFGHLKYWSPENLVRELKTADPLPVLARQLVVMSRIAWIKHKRVQVSLWLGVIGAAAIGAAGVLAGT